MAIYTQLDDVDLDAVAQGYPIGRILRAVGIPKGTVNSNYRLDTERGPLFLRVNEGKSREEVHYEAALIDWLTERGVPTARIVRTSAGEVALERRGSFITVFEWLQGRDLARDEVTPSHTRAVGTALASMHLAGKDFPERRAGRYTFELIAERHRSFEGSQDPELRRAIDQIGEELGWLCLRDRAGLPSGVIHQDLFRDNVMWREDGSLAGLIDFEQACDGAFAYDLAVTFNDWCFGDADFLAGHAAALVAGYASVRPLEPAERAGLYVEARAAAMRFTVTRITDVYLRAAQGGTRVVKDFRRYLARLERLRALGPKGFAALLTLA